LKDIKQELEFQNKLERTAPPNLEKANTQIINATTGDAVQTTSSAEYVTSEIKKHKSAFIAVLVFLSLAIGGLGFWYFNNSPADAKQIASIAVLPFQNGSNDANLDYLSDGVSESLIDRLAELPQLKVIARSSSFKYRGENIDLQEAANKLGVQAIITGRVVQRGDNLSIRVEMIDMRDNRQLWSEQYNRKVTDALTIQQEIAQTVSEKLRLKLSGAQEQQLAKRNTVNPQAYDLLLKGRFFWNKGAEEDRRKAVEYYNQAITVEPNFALAIAELSNIYAILVSYSLLVPKEFAPKAEDLARKALELDENLAEAHLALARLKENAWDWAEAEREYKRALELKPNLAAAHDGYSLYLAIIQRSDEAIAESNRARELDPLSIFVNSNLGWILENARRYDEAIASLNKTLELENYAFAHTRIGYAYAGKGMHREAVAAYQEAIKAGDNSTSTQIYLGAAYAMSGKRKEALAILDGLKTTDEYVSPAELAILYAGLGDKDGAFVTLERAYAAHDLQLKFLAIDSGFDSLRDDPRFQDLLRRVGLPQ